MELSGYLAIARRWWWTLLIATWVAGLSGYVVASGLPRTYEAEVRLLVGPFNTDLNTQRAAGQLAQTYAELITSQPLLEGVIKELGLKSDVVALQQAVSASPNDVTRFVAIRVQLTDPERAAQIANSLAQELAELASGAGLARPEGEVRVIDYADPPTTPVAPQVSLIVILAAAAGLLGAIVVVLLVEYFSDTVRSSDDLQTLVDGPVLGSLRTTSSGDPSSVALVPLVAPGSRAAAGYRVLATKIAFARPDRPIRALLVLGTSADDGSALIATNLAASLAAGGQRVAIVDGDPEEAQITAAFALEGRPGLAEYVAGESGPAVALSVPGGTSLLAIPRGNATTRIASSELMERLLRDLHKKADLVVIHGGSVNLSPGALLWARAADAVVLAVRRDLAAREDVRATAEALRLVGADLVGTILCEQGPRSGGRRRWRTPQAVPPRPEATVAAAPAAALVPSARRPPAGRPARVRVSHARPARDAPGKGDTSGNS